MKRVKLDLVHYAILYLRGLLVYRILEATSSHFSLSLNPEMNQTHTIQFRQTSGTPGATVIRGLHLIVMKSLRHRSNFVQYRRRMHFQTERVDVNSIYSSVNKVLLLFDLDNQEQERRHV